MLRSSKASEDGARYQKELKEFKASEAFQKITEKAKELYQESQARRVYGAWTELHIIHVVSLNA